MKSLKNLPPEALYIGQCACHEWVLVRFLYAHRCGACGERPELIGDYDGRTDWGRDR